MIKYFLASLVILAVGAEAQTISASRTSYYMSYYADSEGYDASVAISDLGAPWFENKTFKLRFRSRTRSVYTDSYGARMNCVETRSYTKCSYSGSYVDSNDGTNCLEKYVYMFRSVKKNVLVAVFRELYQCDDGWWRALEYSGRAKYKVSRK